MALTSMIRFAAAAMLALAGPAGAPSSPPPVPSVAAPGAASAGDRVPGEDAVFARFIAPCCWQQTLDVHASPEAAALRDEIRLRLRQGESREAIQAALVDRYGSRIVAAPAPERIQALGPISLAAALAVGGGAMLRWFFRRRERSAPGPEPARAAREGDEADLDARIDAELADLEG